MMIPPPTSTLFPYTTLFRSHRRAWHQHAAGGGRCSALVPQERERSEEHTSELQSQFHLVCRLLLEKKKKSLASIAPLQVKVSRKPPGSTRLRANRLRSL